MESRVIVVCRNGVHTKTPTERGFCVGEKTGLAGEFGEGGEFVGLVQAEVEAAFDGGGDEVYVEVDAVGFEVAPGGADGVFFFGVGFVEDDVGETGLFGGLDGDGDGEVEDGALFSGEACFSFGDPGLGPFEGHGDEDGQGGVDDGDDGEGEGLPCGVEQLLVIHCGFSCLI